MTLLDRLITPDPKRVLALDGGGIRSVLTLDSWRESRRYCERHGNQRLVLADYFDLIGGTSTGSIIAASLALGMTVDDLRTLYLEAGGKVFGDKVPLWQHLRTTYGKRPLQAVLKDKLGDVTLGDERLKTGLYIITKRVDTNSTWPLHNPPRGLSR